MTDAVASFSEFARRQGIKPSYVTQLRKDGRLVLTDDGKHVRVAESLARIEGTRDPSKAGVAARHAAARGAVNGQGDGGAAPSAPAEQERVEDPDISTEGLVDDGYQYWRKRTERAKALQAERENALAEGKLLDAGQVDAAAAEAATRFRAALEAMPYDLAPELAPITDEAQVRARLVEAVEHALTELSRQFGALTKEKTT